MNNALEIQGYQFGEVHILTVLKRETCLVPHFKNHELRYGDIDKSNHFEARRYARRDLAVIWYGKDGHLSILLQLTEAQEESKMTKKMPKTWNWKRNTTASKRSSPRGNGEALETVASIYAKIVG